MSKSQNEDSGRQFSKREEKEKKAAMLVIANNELAFQSKEKEKRAAELIIANKELVFQNEEKEKRAAELIIANKELAFQNKEKEKRADELIIANKELAFQNKEKEKRADELIVANKELAFQNEEKEKRADELIIANKELAFQNEEKEKRADELIIANKELAFQNEEKEKRADELIIANKELAFQNKEKEKRADELIIANKELAFQNEEKEKRATELIKANRLYTFISQINHTIVHSENKKTVFKEACRIAIEFGKFRMAWIGIIDTASKKISLTESGNMTPDDVALFTGAGYGDNVPLAYVLHTGTSYICNDVGENIELSGWKKYADARGISSVMVLPIKKAGAIIGTFNLYATEKNLFDKHEIALLEEVAGDISFALDVFEKEQHRKEMADKVIQSELQLKHAQAIAHLGSWDLIFEAGVAVWSDEACRIYGLEVTDNLHSYDKLMSFIHPEDMVYVMKEIKKGRELFRGSAFHHRIILKTGEVRHIYSQFEYEFKKNGEPIGLHGVVHDLTEMKEAEEGLARSEANLRLIMDLIPQSIFAKDYNGKFVFVNKSFAGLYGLTPEEIMVHPFKKMIPVKDDEEYFLKQDQEVILSGEMKTIPEHTFTDAKGNIRLFHTIKVPFIVAGSNEKAVLGITMDITEEKRAEKERTKMIDDIVQRNKNLEQFSYIISHNLRAPVANIIGLAEVLQMPELDIAEEKILIGELGATVKKLDDVIMDLNEILQIKHTENKKMEAIAFSKLLQEIRLSIDNLIRNDDVQIITDFSAVDEMLTIKSYLYSIFFNLISNSIKYRQPKIQPIIKIMSVCTDKKIGIIYTDNGLGIDLEQNGRHMFGLYKRFHRHMEGKGVGLFMVKTQVELLGGKISVASKVNEGTEFRIDFK